MKHVRQVILAILLFFIYTTYGQQAYISPVPQSVQWGNTAFSNTVSFKIMNEKYADKDALALLKKNINISSKGIPIYIGERKDRPVRNYSALIPSKSEGYFLDIKPRKVVIAGNDAAGTFYGVQTFLQILKSSNVLSVTISDYPDITDRGVIEGFYGNPFSHQDRLRQLEFYGKNKMNTYIYGPKDDPYHGFSDRWRDFYPAEDAARIKELIDAAHKNKVKFVWAVHPGNDIHWNYADSVATVKKFEAMYDLGVRAFAVFFDDIGGIGTDATKQAGYMNYLQDEFVKKKKDVDPLILCPTQYNQGWSGGDYLDILGDKMYPEIRIMWTGKSVVRMIDNETMDWINARINRNAYIWLNYPVNDYLVDHLLMGPVYGNEKDIADKVSGFVSNPMEYAEASKLAVYSIADYTWNMSEYDSLTSWNQGIKYLMPENEEAFKIFSENNIDLGPSGHGLRRANESAAFKVVADRFTESYNKNIYPTAYGNQLLQHFQSFRDASKELANSTYNIPLREEIKPWLQAFDIIGQKGITLLDLYKNLVNKDSIKFINNYLKFDSLDVVQKNIRSRDFEGSIKKPNPKPANEVVMPFINSLRGRLAEDYRQTYQYRMDVFPVRILQDGRYYIKVDGKYLTNQNVNARGGSPVFVASKDSINPQRQEWLITIDPSSERYKIVNVQDNRYINELGRFGVNPYNPGWNSYIISKKEDLYAIQNPEYAGESFWIVTEDAIKNTKNKEANHFVFELIPINN